MEDGRGQPPTLDKAPSLSSIMPTVDVLLPGPIPSDESAELALLARRIGNDLVGEASLFGVFRMLQAIQGLEAGESFWHKTSHPQFWARFFWNVAAHKLQRQYPDESVVVALSMSPVLGLLGATAGVSADELSGMRARLAASREGGALCVTSLFDEDLPEFAQADGWLAQRNKRALFATWLSQQQLGIKGTVTELLERNRRWALDRLSELAPEALFFQPQSAFSDVYCADSPSQYGQVREAFMAWARAKGQFKSMTGKRGYKAVPGKRPRVGIVSANWVPHHSAYKALHRQVYAMRDRFELVLVNLSPWRQPADATMFSKVVPVPLKLALSPRGYHLDLDDRQLVAEKLDVLYFAEAYTQEADSLMMLRRYAPVQVTGYGFLSSTRSPFMDWYITGAAVEPELIQPLYSERICQVPGIGLLSSRRPAVAPLRPADGFPRVVSTTSQIKYRVAYLQALKRIGEGLGTRGRLLVLPNRPFLDSIQATAAVRKRLEGTPVDHATALKDDYLATLAGAAVMLDSFPFGGYTTLVDAFSYGVPVVTREGVGAAGRLGAAVARMAGMPEWAIARTDDEYVAAALRLVHEPEERAALSLHLRSGLDALFEPGQEHALGEAIAQILASPKAAYLQITRS